MTPQCPPGLTWQGPNIEELRRIALAQHAQIQQLIRQHKRKCDTLSFYAGNEDELQQTLARIDGLVKESEHLADRGKKLVADAKPRKTPNHSILVRDTQLLTIDVFSPSTPLQGRYLSVTGVSSFPAAYDLLPSMGPVVFGASDVSATWQALPSGSNTVLLNYHDTNAEENLLVTAGVLGGTQTVVFDRDVPGYQPAWQVQDAGAKHEFEANRIDVGSVTITTGSSTSD